MKKITRGKLFLEENYSLFQCPVCQSDFIGVEEHSLCCQKGHRFDLAKKGNLYFLIGASKNEYDKEMLQSRYRIAQAGLFNGILKAIMPELTAHQKKDALLDVGCGEGSQLAFFADQGIKGPKIGFDISKDAVQLAATHFEQAFWCVADLAKSPFASAKYQTILNIFSPSNYQEFKRLLADGGQLIKVVPAENYLGELRQLLYQDQSNKQSYSNQEVVDKFKEHFPKMTVKQVTYSFDLKENDFFDLLEMTPLQWGATKEAVEQAKKQPLKSITVDVVLLIGKK
ncbi:methyltransferase domain-containing protein [Isobaculum melis]|uniref:23S rRNA (Guanine745-N1)-methyltransferase n=1 Tax=Isobaculum melis TaxID=142588 RepID=A0A1H9QKW1_9LACT|nr:methyltransferase domain-containing protein [Isobaculum melis]SER60499.1 23S rRNA (guanine745-N1)-methyltransferase [Isobaculum melis]